MEYIEYIKSELGLPKEIILKVISLLDDGATIPFIARYRKELTGNLDEVQLIKLKDRKQFWEEFEKRKSSIIKAIDSQNKLSDELSRKIEKAKTLEELEDIYLPYKLKRKSKAQKAIDQGLKPLAILIQRESNANIIERSASRYIHGDVIDEKDALEGAVSIVAEWISEISRVRERLRDQFQKFSIVIAKVKRGKKDAGIKYKDFFDFNERSQRIASHRILALFRAEKEAIINLKIEVDEEKAIQNITYLSNRLYADNVYVKKAIKEAYKRILQANFESEIRKQLKEKADQESISVFAENLKQLLLQSPLGAKNVLAIDPGFRSGCKIAVLNRNGAFIRNETIYPHPPQNKTTDAEAQLKKLIKKYEIEALAIGNGTAGLETEKLCRELFKDSALQVFSVNEAGASIYSASEIAREEFPSLDLTVRGAISIGRRLMDPLAELVKIDAKSIGVGQYQHDVNQTLLNSKLDEVVEHSVNHVGVELNTASYPILSYVSGLGPTMAKNIVAFRNEYGDFKERKQLLKVAKLGKKSYEQAAGFLRISNGENPLDNTIIHPESYKIAEELAKINHTSIQNILNKQSTINEESIKSLETKYNRYTINLIVKELQRPSIDPREPLRELKSNLVSSIEELHIGMLLEGTINNITKFGAFVNIGIKESGLVHVSEISNTYVTDIQKILKLNQQVKVKVISIDVDRKRVQLSMKQV